MYGDRRGGPGGGRGGFNRGPREMHTVTCSDCGQETQVPFKPAEGRPVYCRDCYQKHKGDQGGSGRFERREEPRAPKEEAEPEYEDSEDFGEDEE